MIAQEHRNFCVKRFIPTLVSRIHRREDGALSIVPALHLMRITFLSALDIAETGDGYDVGVDLFFDEHRLAFGTKKHL